MGADLAEGGGLGELRGCCDDPEHRWHHSRLTLLMSMRVLLASLLSASAVLGGAPVMALPTLDDLEIELRGEAQGWLNATCTYYGLGWINEDQGRKALRRLTTLIKGSYLGHEALNQATKIALERDPGCQAIWPDTGK